MRQTSRREGAFLSLLPLSCLCAVINSEVAYLGYQFAESYGLTYKVSSIVVASCSKPCASCVYQIIYSAANPAPLGHWGMETAYTPT